MQVSDLEIELNSLKSQLGVTNKRFYHLNSISNFLFNYNSLKDNDSKEYVLNLLSGCFKYYNEYPIQDTKQSLSVFQEYLAPVGKIYARQLGFFIFVKPWILFSYILLGYGIVYFIFNNNFTIVMFFLLIVFGFIFYLGIKFSQRKLYAFLW